MRAWAQTACLLGFLAALQCLVAPLPAQASEEIRSFHADVLVSSNGALYVRETIHYAIGRGLRRHGIFRDFLLNSPTAEGGRRRVTFTVLSVKRNGQPEQYKILDDIEYARVQIGRSGKILGANSSDQSYIPPTSDHVYEIFYRTEGQLRNFDEYDELYWNVTGNRWELPIQWASVKITLPPAATLRQHSAYTGPSGPQIDNVMIITAADGLYRAETIAPIGPRESFGVKISWSKNGASAGPPPGSIDLEYGRFAAYTATLAGVIALFLCWLFVGRDPRKGVIYPEFEPPRGIGPAAARYLHYQMFDDRCLTAAIVSMAVKGALRIVEKPSTTGHQGGSYWLEPFGSSCKPLTPGERAAYFALFPTAQSLELVADRTNGRRMDNARAALRAKLVQELYGASLRRNTFYTLAGISVGILTAFFMMLPATATGESLSELLVLWLVAFVTGLLVVFGAAVLAGAFSTERFVSRYGMLIVRGLVVLNLTVHMVVWNTISSADVMDPGVLGAGVTFGVLAGLFFILMEAPTKAGRRLLDRIEGFALYLTVAETVRLNLLNPPERTPELFERFLPYAIALDVTHEWGEMFTGVLNTTSEPDWLQCSTTADGKALGRSFIDHEALERGLGSAVSSTSFASPRSSDRDSRGDANW